MSEDNAWTEEVKTAIADRAYTLNYDEGMSCRFRPLPSEDRSRTIEVYLETTHLGQPFDLTWLVRFTDSPETGIDFDLVAPADAGGSLWKNHYDTVAKLKDDAYVLPFFIRGYFVGRDSVATGASAGENTPLE